MFNKSVASITKSFTKMLNDLDNIVEDKQLEVDWIATLVENLKKLSGEASLEISRAKKVASKIKEIIGE